MLALLLSSVFAWAASVWSVESAPHGDKAAVDAVRLSAEQLGYSPRVVRRFRLGEGWGWVAIVDGFDAASSAESAARTLAGGSTLVFSVVEQPSKSAAKKTAPVAVTPVADAAVPPSAGEWVARVVAAHGGLGGGAVALSRAKAVHFIFERTVQEPGSAPLVVTHDYWREGPNRRLAVAPAGVGEKSLAVATGSAAWVAASGRVESRDIGVVINQIDAFAPETVLSVAIDVATLLAAPDDLVLLEGAERGIRIGRGEDPAEPGLAFMDIDPETGRLHSVRYVTEGGPVEFVYDGWRSVTTDVYRPDTMVLTRPDGHVERVAVSLLDAVDAAPSGSFGAPVAP